MYDGIERTIGNTPLVRLRNIEKKYGAKATIAAKLEYFNPAGSAKDRVAAAMIAAAEKSGELKKGATIIEPTSGNTGIGLAMLGAARGYKVVIVMPDTMSVERIKTIRAYGAEVVLTDGKLGMNGAIAKAEELKTKTQGAFVPAQFENESNPAAHEKFTGPEIFSDCPEIDVFVAGVGTGGTITGVGRYLKCLKPSVKIIAVEPERSPVLSGGNAGAHRIQGIGAGFIPKILDRSVIDMVTTVSDEAAVDTAKETARTEGMFIGISSGAAAAAAIALACKNEYAGKTIVTLFPDSGDRYLSVL